MDTWTGEAREAGEIDGALVRNPQVFYDESQGTIRMESQRFIYGNIAGLITEEIARVEIVQYLMAKNTRWTEAIFETIDWNSIGSYVSKMS